MSGLPSPSERSCNVVARQLAAYNARDLEAFMACWHREAQLLLFPSALLATGSDEIRTRHAARFFVKIDETKRGSS